MPAGHSKGQCLPIQVHKFTEKVITSNNPTTRTVDTILLIDLQTFPRFLFRSKYQDQLTGSEGQSPESN